MFHLNSDIIPRYKIIFNIIYIFGINYKCYVRYEIFQKHKEVLSLQEAFSMTKPKLLKKIDKDAVGKHDTEKTGLAGKLGALVKRAINCCIE